MDGELIPNLFEISHALAALVIVWTDIQFVALRITKYRQ